MISQIVRHVGASSCRVAVPWKLAVATGGANQPQRGWCSSVRSILWLRLAVFVYNSSRIAIHGSPPNRCQAHRTLTPSHWVELPHFSYPQISRTMARTNNGVRLQRRLQTHDSPAKQSPIRSVVKHMKVQHPATELTAALLVGCL